MEAHPREDEPRSALRGVLLVGLALFALVVIGVVILAWVTGDSHLPMEYEGFN